MYYASLLGSDPSIAPCKLWPASIHWHHLLSLVSTENTVTMGPRDLTSRADGDGSHGHAVIFLPSPDLDSDPSLSFGFEELIYTLDATESRTFDPIETNSGGLYEDGDQKRPQLLRMLTVDQEFGLSEKATELLLGDLLMLGIFSYGLYTVIFAATVRQIGDVIARLASSSAVGLNRQRGPRDPTSRDD
ncbi:hypothetical protein CPB85DRAFT_1461480, partial [Mucidula mucida]